MRRCKAIRSSPRRASLPAPRAPACQPGREPGGDPSVVGRRLVVRLVFTTGDAVGSNMAARAANRCCRRISQATGAERYFLHGQDSEKRASSRNAIEGRGRSVIAEATIPATALEELLRVRPQDLVEIQRAYAVGFWQLGTAMTRQRQSVVDVPKAGGAPVLPAGVPTP